MQVFHTNRQGKPSASQRASGFLNSAIKPAVEHLQGRQQKQQQSDKVSELLGQDVSGISPQLQEKLLELKMREQSALEVQKLKGEQLAGRESNQKNQEKFDVQQQKQNEKIATFENALETINEMRSISSKGNLGRGSQIFGYFGGETSKDRGQYEQLGKSLIQLSTNIPIRNQREFETLAHNLYNPSLPDAQREGILDSMESLINRSLQAVSPHEEELESETELKPLDQEVMQKIYKLSGGDKAKAKRIAKKMGYSIE